MYKAYLQRLQEENKMSANKLKVVLFLGSVRENRIGLRVAKFMKRKLEERNYAVEFFGKNK